MPGEYRIRGGDEDGARMCARRTETRVIVKDKAVHVADDLVISGYALSVLPQLVLSASFMSHRHCTGPH